MSNSGAGESHGGHGGGLVIDEAVIGDLNSAAVIVHGLIRVLLKIRKVGANGFCRVFWLEGVEELFLDVIPDGEVDGVISEGLPPDDGAVPEAQLDLPNLLGLIPSGDSSGILDSINENPGEYGIFVASSVKKWDVHRTSHTVMVIESGGQSWPGGGGELNHGNVGSSGEGLAVSS